MRRTAAVLAVVALLVAPAFSQGKLGVGGSFWAGQPVFDIFAEVMFAEMAGMRFTGGIVFSGGGLSAFTLDATLLMLLGFEGIQPYFGAGAGAFVLTGGGAAMGVFTVNGIAGVSIPLGDAFGVYGQVRFLGQVGGGGFVGDLLPGVGLYVNF